HVPLHARCTQYRSSYTQRLAVAAIQDAYALGALHPDAVCREQLFVFAELRLHEVAKLLYLFFEAVVGVVLAAADAERVRRQPRATIFLDNLQDLFAIAECVEQRRHCAYIERVRAEPHLVASDPLQLREDDADVLRARWRFHVDQGFDRLAVAQPVGDGRNIVHAIDVGREHRVGAAFADLLDTAVQVADHALGAEHLLAVELQDDAQHTVRRRMLRAHVEDELVGIEDRGP